MFVAFLLLPPDCLFVIVDCCSDCVFWLLSYCLVSPVPCIRILFNAFHFHMLLIEFFFSTIQRQLSSSARTRFLLFFLFFRIFCPFCHVSSLRHFIAFVRIHVSSDTRIQMQSQWLTGEKWAKLPHTNSTSKRQRKHEERKKNCYAWSVVTQSNDEILLYTSIHNAMVYWCVSMSEYYIFVAIVMLTQRI